MVWPSTSTTSPRSRPDAPIESYRLIAPAVDALRSSFSLQLASDRSRVHHGWVRDPHRRLARGSGRLGSGDLPITINTSAFGTIWTAASGLRRSVLPSERSTSPTDYLHYRPSVEMGSHSDTMMAVPRNISDANHV
ncbi:hypothetical protein [Halocatena salina]|uniref:Uncharacterized protein n=1 Tax=Halocatena salina TaxID=2934340 RepID=A0A8U0A6G4_9EURY|nr:hypothetical protein [Halocatena salina]UPM44614.1 hypothetical protein MW046_16330 [Halocatena salina]